MSASIPNFLAASDPIMEKIIPELTLPDIPSTSNVFHDLVSCVVEQQIHYRSSKKLFAKLLLNASIEELTLDNFGQFEDKGLANLKLSMRKYETLAALENFFQTHSPDWEGMNDQEVRKTLTGISGIGNWTADMILIFTLGRSDVFPAKDYHVKKIMGNLYDNLSMNLSEKKLKEIAENWKPYRSYAVRYLWAWKQALIQQ